jgi:tRNA(Ile)-lysidine synthase TilS/MesJ
MQKQINLIFRSSHGDRYLVAGESDSVVDVCRKYGIPTTQVSTYLNSRGGELTLFVKPRQPLGEYAGDSEVIIIPNRNIDYHALLGGDDIVRERPGASTWLRIREGGSESTAGFVTELLGPAQAQEFVAAQVKEALLLSGVEDEPLVVGVSGGGDSNALLGAIIKSGLISKENILPVMMLGIPDWDKGADRAAKICAEHGLALRTVPDEETARILGFTDPKRDWVTAFEQAFPGDDLEVLGVYGVRRVLEHVAIERGAKKIVIGSNLEDCLSDVLYYICAGKVPFPKPCGRMGKVDILYPLWLTPKAIIDGCYPKYSLENYEARYPSRMYGRAYFYYLAQMLVDAYPGAGQDILRGAGKLSQELFQELPYDQEFDTPTISPIPLDVRLKLRKLFGTRITGTSGPKSENGEKGW